MAQYTTADKLASFKQFNCTGCGSALDVVNQRTNYISCKHCGSVLDANSEEHQILAELGKPSQHEPQSFIKTGMIANFNGVKYQVIARTRWQSAYNEFWMEDGQAGYSQEHWVYDEWLMISEARTYFYLIEDREGFYISEEIIPETPCLLPEDLRMSLFHDQPEQIVQEYGSSQVVFFEGESYYKIRQGDMAQFAMFKDRGILYSSEWRLDENNDVKEVEFFKETPISRVKVLEAFEQNEEIQKIREENERRRFIFRAAGIAALIMLVMMISACNRGGDNAKTLSLNMETVDPNVGSIEGPFDLEAGFYEMQMSGQFTSSAVSSVFASAFILDNDKTAINRLSGNFSSYSNSKSKRMKIAEKGSYYIQMFALNPYATTTTSPTDTSRRALPVPVTMEVKFNKGVMIWGYFLLAALVCLIVMIMYRKKSI